MATRRSREIRESSIQILNMIQKLLHIIKTRGACPKPAPIGSRRSPGYNLK
jgi:hypothetical protein